MITVKKPKKDDLNGIHRILLQWTEKSEADKYIKRITSEIKGTTEFNMRFWVARDNGQAIGIVGLADPLPKVLPLSKTKEPVEMKILYVDSQHQRKGAGRILAVFVENKAKENGYSELMVRSAEKYEDTAWRFYDQLGYERIGSVSGGKESKMMQVFSKKL